MVDFEFQNAITLTEAAQLLPAGRGKRLRRDVVYRWAVGGYAPRGWTGDKVTLPSELVGGTRYTMRQWVEEFQAKRLEMSRTMRDTRPRMAPIGQAGRSHDSAMRQLRERGLA